MKKLLLTLGAFTILGFGSAGADPGQHVITAPPGTPLAQPTTHATVPCDTQIRYDDGTDDTPSSGPALGWFTPTNYQYLGVRFTPPGGQSYEVQSASWFSEFWVQSGLVDVTAMEVGNPINAVTASLFVTAGGTWEVQFPNPICIPPDGSYDVMLCPQPGVYGEIGDDHAASDFRSYVSTTTGCAPAYLWFPDELDFMLWSCVTPCGSVPAPSTTWGYVKSIYR